MDKDKVLAEIQRLHALYYDNKATLQELEEYLDTMTKQDTVLSLYPKCNLYQLADRHPDLIFINRAEDLSQAIFGVKSLTSKALELLEHYWSITYVRNLVAFCGEDKSTLVKIIRKYSLNNFNCRAEVSHRKTYQWLVREIGEDAAIACLISNDFPDTCTGIEWAKRCNKIKSLRNKIFSSLKLFPSGCWPVMIHDYLMNAMNRAAKSPTENTPAVPLPITLPQPVQQVPNKIGEYKVLIPKHERDLSRIGTAQGHCVGTRSMGYADKIRNGRSAIFALYTNTLSDGVCVEVDRSSLHVLQAQGKYRRDPCQKEWNAIREVTEYLKDYVRLD